MTGFDVATPEAGLPDLRARGERQAPRLPRLRVVVAEAARGARRDGRLLPALLRQHPPRRVLHRRGSDRRVRGRARARSRGSSTRRRPEEVVFVRNATEAINLVAYTWARANLQRRRRDRAVAHGAPRQRRAVAHARRRARRRVALDPAHRRLPPRPHEPRRAARRRQAARDQRDVERARHHQRDPAARRRGPRARRTRVRRRVPVRAARRAPMSRRGTPTSSRSPRTSCSARAASVRCGPATSCSRRCRRSSVAAR